MKSVSAPFRCVPQSTRMSITTTPRLNTTISTSMNVSVILITSVSKHTMTSTTSYQGYFLTERQSQGRHSYHVYTCTSSVTIPSEQIKTIKNSRWSYSWKDMFLKFLQYLQTALFPYPHPSTYMYNTLWVVYIKCTKALHSLQQCSGVYGQTSR